MGFENVTTNRVDRNHYDRDPPPQLFFANIVLIDKTHRSTHPTVYQFLHDMNYSDTELASIERHYLESLQDSFMLLGDMRSIDKKKSLIFLNNGNSVSYKHLVLVSEGSQHSIGSLSQQKEFVDALHKLIDALRVNRKVPSSSASSRMDQDVHHTASTETSSLPVNISRVFSSQIEAYFLAANVTQGSVAGKRLFEFQI